MVLWFCRFTVATVGLFFCVIFSREGFSWKFVCFGSDVQKKTDSHGQFWVLLFNTPTYPSFLAFGTIQHATWGINLCGTFSCKFDYANIVGAEFNWIAVDTGAGVWFNFRWNYKFDMQFGTDWKVNYMIVLIRCSAYRIIYQVLIINVKQPNRVMQCYVPFCVLKQT